jgi:hypothetical protein
MQDRIVAQMAVLDKTAAAELYVKCTVGGRRTAKPASKAADLITPRA